jgi:hypothetical protein
VGIYLFFSVYISLLSIYISFLFLFINISLLSISVSTVLLECTNSSISLVSMYVYIVHH